MEDEMSYIRDSWMEISEFGLNEVGLHLCQGSFPLPPS